MPYIISKVLFKSILVSNFGYFVFHHSPSDLCLIKSLIKKGEMEKYWFFYEKGKNEYVQSEYEWIDSKHA